MVETTIISKESLKEYTATTENNDKNEQITGLKVIKRNGSVTVFDKSKIAIAMTKAFLAIESGSAAASTRVHQIVSEATDNICKKLQNSISYGNTIDIETIQDLVELELMRTEPKVAKAYILYRNERQKMREDAPKPSDAVISVTLANGQRAPLNLARYKTIIEEACQNLEFVDADLLAKDTLRNLYDGMPQAEVRKALILSARTHIEKEPNYSYVAARLLLDDLRAETLTFLKLAPEATHNEMKALYPEYFAAYIDAGIRFEKLSPQLKSFDLVRLGQALKPERDLQFSYLGLQTLYDRYFIHEDGNRIEIPQAFFMRVAMGLALEEAGDKTARAIEFYNLISSFDYMCATPTLFNSGTLRPQLSSCYLTTVPDDLDGIFGAIKDNALLSKFAGGLGNDWTPVRALNSHIKGTNGKSQGVIPFLKVANDTAIAVNQGGKRKGAVCAYLGTQHLDIEEFVELRKNTGDDRRRTHDMNTANWIPDLFMQRVMEDKQWTLFSPEETPELHDLYGKAFEEAYIAYEAKADRGEIKNFKRISAVVLWRKMLSLLFETGHPWVTFKDPCNLRSPQQHAGVIHSSNLCTEITLNTSKDEIAVCNLGSLNLPAYIDENGLNLEKLKTAVRTAVRMLDNVIDINYYSVPQARRSNLKHRPVGMGLMGFQDALYKLRIPYDSQEAIEFADKSMEYISYFAIEASSDLAKERGSYSTYEGSLWSRGILPIDSIELLAKARGQYLDMDRTQRLDWTTLRQKVKTQGMRNSNVMAIAPTATISNICGVSQSIEPTYQNLFVKSNLSGEFTVINPYLVDELKLRGLWDEVMVNDLKYFDGSVQQIARIPAELKQLYKTAFELDASWLIEAASRRQKWIDQGQSLNLYMAKPSGKKLDQLYKLAWLRGLKTTYYLRTLGATAAEKSTVYDKALNAVSNAAPKACSINDPDCEACQ